ncbi:MAG TPA: transglycosylase SLT domain-containing protein [Stellaceae bacterium]|nr:transglycosylase SLT domain-containing protein [Stellaceae bacterium]
MDGDFDPTSNFNFASLLAPSLVDPNTGQPNPLAIQQARAQNALLGAAAGAASVPYASRLPIGWGQSIGAAAGGLLQGQIAGDENLRRNLLIAPTYQEAMNRAAFGAMQNRGYNLMQGGLNGGPVNRTDAIASAGPGGYSQPNLLGGPASAPSSAPAQRTYFDALSSAESGGNPQAQNPNSTATGPAQFTAGTWAHIYNTYLKDKGFPNDPTNPDAAKAATAYLAMENGQYLQPWLGRVPNNSELGLAHFLGAQGALRFLGAPTPSALGIDYASNEAVAANHNVFYDGNRPRTVGEIRADYDRRFANTQPLFGAPQQSQAAPQSQAYSGAAPSGTAPGSPVGNAGTRPAAPMFNIGSLYNQARTAMAYGLPFAGQLLDLANKTANTNLEQGAYLGQDGAVYVMPGANAAQMGKALAAKGYQQTANGGWVLNPAVPQGEAAIAGAKARATLGPDVLKALAERAAYPVRYGPNETVETGLNLLPPDLRSAMLGAMGVNPAGGSNPQAGSGAPAPSAQAGSAVPQIPPVNVIPPGYPRVSGAPASGSAAPAPAPAAPSAGAPAPAPRSPQSFAIQNLFGASNDLPEPPRVQPFPTQPIHNPDGSVSSPYTTSTIGLQEEANKAYAQARTQFAAGQTIQQRLAMIDHGIDLLNQSGWSSTGAGAETKLEGLKYINSWLTSVGVSPLSDPRKIASFEDLIKETGNLGLDRARSMGSREAAQVVSLSIGLNPGVGNTYQGAKTIEASMGAAAQRDVDYFNFATKYAQQNGSTFGADVEFNKLRPPEMYARRAIAATIPQGAIALLQSRPAAAAQFDDKYGRGMAAFVLRGALDGMPYVSNAGLPSPSAAPSAPVTQ